MVPRQRSAAKDILSFLDTDPALIEHYDPNEIEATPLAAIQARLVELELTPTMPIKLQRILLESTPSPAVRVLRVLADDLECVQPQDIEAYPLDEVTACLQRGGINYRAGVRAIIDFMSERASESVSLDKDETKVRSIKSARLRSRKSLLLAIGAAGTATAAVAATVGFFVAREVRQDKTIAEQRYETQELSAQIQGLKARVEELSTSTDDLISLTMRVPPSNLVDHRTWPQQSDDSNASAMGVRVVPETPSGDGSGAQVADVARVRSLLDSSSRGPASVAPSVGVGVAPEVPPGATPSLAARAPQPGLPVVAFVTTRSADASVYAVAAFRKGLGETGYVEGRNVTVAYHWLNGQLDRLPALMADLVHRRVAVIATPNNTLVTTAAKAATATIPIVFSVGMDPVKTGLVESFARPGGNATGINYFALELTAKRLALLHALAPKAVRVAILVNPANGPSADLTVRNVQDAARSIGLQTKVLNAGTSSEIDAAIASLAREQVDDVLFVAADGFLQSRGEQLAALTARYKIPAAYPDRAAVAAGGLMSYGADGADMYRQVGVYTGNILKGAKPADLPVQQSTKFEFVINRKTGKALGLEIPVMLMVSATELVD